MNVTTGKQKGGFTGTKSWFFFKQLTVCDKNLDSQEINNKNNIDDSWENKYPLPFVKHVLFQSHNLTFTCE